MGHKRNIGRAACATALLGIAAPSAAAQAAREPLVVTELGKPDPGLGAAPEPQLELTSLRSAEDDESAIDRAVQNLGRALNDSVAEQQQAREARCRSAVSAKSSTADRFTWAANCRYSRH